MLCFYLFPSFFRKSANEIIDNKIITIKSKCDYIVTIEKNSRNL